MLFRVLELCLTIVALALTTTEVILPLLKDQPLFPALRRAFIKGDSK